jgi:hypothetical protein
MPIRLNAIPKGNVGKVRKETVPNTFPECEYSRGVPGIQLNVPKRRSRPRVRPATALNVY